MQYAMSIILGRALPDARDGLKPVHRRILYAMHGLGLSPDASYRKCARIVGEVLGKYHPHGDVAVYDALVRMAQDFVMMAPLVSGHGNFGSVDNDPAAAMRYTEGRMSRLTKDALLRDINLDTVDFAPNFDGSEQEPVVLPARIPMLLLNGASGIAVGMATNIPPHNLGELIDATVGLVDRPDMSDDELFKLIPAPDFPTGGQIIGLSGPRDLYQTSNGRVVIRAKTHIESMKAGKGRQQKDVIVVTELPYMVNKAGLLQKIADLVNEKKIEGISDLRDESDRDGMRIVLELKRDAVAQVVENNLLKKTALQTQFSGNMVALAGDGTRPKRFSLKEAIQTFITFRFDTVRRRTAHELGIVDSRRHIVIGLLKALEKADAVIDLIRKSRDTASARDVLMSETFGLSKEQADAVLGLRLGRLTEAEDSKLRGELADLSKEAERLGKLMADDGAVYSLMKAEMTEIKEKHAQPRRSVILPDQGELQAEDFLANDNSIVVVTQAGYIKRMPLDDFRAQARGTKGKAGAKLADDEDQVKQLFACRDHDTLVFISNRGIAYSIRAFQVPVASRTARGVPVPQVLPLSPDDHIATVLPVSKFTDDDEYVVGLTRNGKIKRTPLKVFESTTARGLIMMGLEADDTLEWVKRCTVRDSVIIGTRQGFATRFLVNDEQLRPTGRTSKGVLAMKYREGDAPVDMDILPGNDDDSLGEGRSLLIITSQGYGKRVDAKEFRCQNRRGLGVIATKFKKKGPGDELAALRVSHENDQIVISTQQGTIVRQAAGMISGQGRTATGVLVQKLDEGDVIAQISVVPEEFLDDD